MLGKKLLVALVILSALGCRESKPPAIDICIGDGFGGADCALKPTSSLRDKCHPLTSGAYYCPPSALVNVWMTPQADMEAFSSWCYQTSKSNVSSMTQAMQKRIQSR